ncbi:FAD-dependent oxidoreductase, partial [Candidatus Peregrinibacteria bacterium]|nr:FAD-dependent oxidoreductase [Candidatus Peregrinibacteria bacterium]
MNDVIIIGGGVAGLGAAVYTGRFNLKTLLLAEMPGGTITLTHLVENYPGYVSLSGQELADHFIEHAKSVGTEIKYEKVVEI